MRLCLAVTALLAAGGSARADPPQTPPSEPAPAAAPAAAEPQAPSPSELDRRLRALDAENQRLREDLEALRQKQEESAQRTARSEGRITGYLDVGFFRVQGNGSGVRPDVGYARFPEYRGIVPDSWVFYGDPLSTTINARGEPADTGDSRALAFDPVDSRGASSFIVNALDLLLFAGLGEHVSVQALVDFVPRGRDVSNPAGTSLGDFIDVKLAYVEYSASTDWMLFSFHAGKVDPVLGVEYRVQESPDRIGVTPSLICRYTCGRPVGVKGRARFLDEALTMMLAVTNGSSVTEMFPFYGEIDRNDFKTVSGRVSYRLDLANLEVGASGLYGAADNQPKNDVVHRHVGLDLRLDVAGLELAAELVDGEIGEPAAGARAVPGQPRCADAPCLSYTGAYGQLGYRVNDWLMPYARVDWRDAIHQSGASFVYVSDVLRATLGVHLELGTHTIAKAEYTLNRELGRLPQFPDDVFTSSLVVRF